MTIATPLAVAPKPVAPNLVTDVAAAGDEPVNILLVDDQPQNLLGLECVLQELGQNLIRAASGAEALRYLLGHDCAAIVLDVYMPEMDGLETASLIRGRDKTRHTPIIFVTAHDAAEGLFRGYELGAIDYLIKPIIPAILRSKVAVLVDLFQMNRKLGRQAEQLREMERARHERELAEAREQWEMERLRQQAQTARHIQERLFPEARIPLPGLDIGGGSFPAEATGGDYFDYFPMIDEGLGVVIGDVSGHGYGPALLMAEIRAYLRALALTHTDIGEIVSLLNRALHLDVPEGLFATLFLGRLDGRRRTFSYASAGHPTGYLLDAAGRVKRRLESTGLPLAIVPDVVFKATDPFPLENGDTILLVTDGILEAPCDDNSLFGSARVLELVRANAHLPAREIATAIYKAVHDRNGGQRQHDDMTAIVIKVEAVPATGTGSDPDLCLSGAVSTSSDVTVTSTGCDGVPRQRTSLA